MEGAYINLSIENFIGTITFSNPKHNALPSHLLKELAQTIMDAGANDEVKVIVLKSAGDRTFCAGASFNELIKINDMQTGKAFFSGFANVINAMRTCGKLVIGRIQGKTVGGGVGLAAACDYTLGTKYAAIKLSELNVGIGPFVVGPAIERKIGLSGMSQIAIDADSFYSAEWAKQKGLFTQVYDSTDDLDEAVKEFAENLCNYNTEAMKEMKTIFWKGTEDWDNLLAERAAISGRLVLSDFTKEKLKGFK